MMTAMMAAMMTPVATAGRSFWATWKIAISGSVSSGTMTIAKIPSR